eukprot:GFUD01076268.1.p1 GENE.GFUD01076268.1~~GFUD01076268.1.p1  ORF type:complete len:102 (-),score=58.72 GFUD01076268.1:26-331(-)
MNNDDFPQQDEEDRHPSIIKNGGLDDTVMSEIGDNAKVNNDLTTVTWTSDEKDEKDEKIEKEEKKDDEKIIKDEKEDEKKEDKEDKVTEDTPLQEEENLSK